MTLEALKMGSYGDTCGRLYALTLIALVVMASLARGASNRELKSARRRMQIDRAEHSADTSSDGVHS